jgi:hypothetical protein
MTPGATIRRRHPLLKALGGVLVLLALGIGAGVGGVHVVQNMINENGKSRLELFTDGSDNPTIVTLGDPTALMRVSLPSAPKSTGHEAMTFFGVVKQVDRAISTAGDDSVAILWFRVVPALARNPQKTLSTLASNQASNLGGTTPLEPRMLSSGSTAAYEFRVHPVGTAAVGADYYVRILLHGDVVYVLRVEAKKGGAAALAKVAGSIIWTPRRA